MTKKTTTLSKFIFFIIYLLFLNVPAIVLADSSNTGILNLKTDPTGALVFVDGKMKGTTPIITEITTKYHTVKLEQQGYKTYSFKISVKKDKVITKRIKLKKNKIKPASLSIKKNIKIYKPNTTSKPGVVFITTTPPGMTAYINNFRISKPSPVAFDIKPGIYTLVLKNIHKKTVYKRTIFVRAGETLPLDIIIRRKRKIDYSDPWSK